MVIDANGQRTGFDSLHEKPYQEIPDSRATRDNARKQLSVRIKPASTNRYTLEITGQPGGEYRLAVGGVSPARASSTMILDGKALARTIVRYRVDLNYLRASLAPGDRMRAHVVSKSERFLSEPETEVLVTKRDSLKEICDYAERELAKVTGAKLSRKASFSYRGVTRSGCAITFSGNDKKIRDKWSPDFLYPYEGSEFYYRGWKPSMEADGPDGSFYHIDNGKVGCDVSAGWDGGMDDQPDYKPSDEFSLNVTCVDKK